MRSIITNRLSPRILIRFFGGLVVSGIFLFLFFRGFDSGRFIIILSQINYFNFIWVILATAAFLYSRAMKWKIILAPLKTITLTSSLANISIGLMGNNLLPARGGELVRVASLSKTEKVRAASIFSALIVERLLDGYILVLFFVLTFHKIELIQSVHIINVLRKAAVMVFAGYSIILSVLIVFVRYGNLDRLRKVTPTRLGFLLQKLDEFRSGLDFIRNYKRLLLICFWSVIIWTLNACITLVTLSMFIPIRPDIYDSIGLVESIFLVGAVSLGLIIPAAPGYFGTYHWIYAMVLVGLGLPKSFSSSFVIFNHGSQYVLITILGIIFFWRSHLRQIGGDYKDLTHLGNV